MHLYSFEKLEVWIEAKSFAKKIYKITSIFPDTEKFQLISQLRRASISICSNIAEGTTRKTYKDQAHFTTMAYGSLIEILNQLILAYELDFISQEKYSELRFEVLKLSSNLNSLRKYQISQTSS